MTGRGKGGKAGRSYTSLQPPKTENETVVLPSDSLVISIFRDAARQLTDRQDRHEKLFKLSRDVTIESKRIIFLLHSSATKETPTENIIAEARDRLQKLINTHFKAIALEMEYVSTYLHTKAYSSGMQEFVEARTFCSYIENKKIMTVDEIQEELKFTLMSDDGNEKTVSVYLLPQDYMLGLADLSGEIMRKTINAIASREIDASDFACDILRKLYIGFMGLYRASPALNSKLNTTRNNLYKVEHAIYTTKVRGSEVIKTSQDQPATPWGHPPEHDEGCY